MAEAIRPPSRTEIATRMLGTVERLERLASRLETYVEEPESTHKKTPRKKKGA